MLMNISHKSSPLQQKKSPIAILFKNGRRNRVIATANIILIVCVYEKDVIF